MLHHHNTTPHLPARAVVLGAGGFIGSAIIHKLGEANGNVLGLGRKELDLLDVQASDKLASLLNADDALVVVSAKAPCKTPAMLLENIKMVAAVCGTLAKRSVAHLVYVSSDAVYADGPLPLTEESPAAPTSLHGAMHLAREQMLLAAAGKTPLAIVRPTLVYGAGDPHNGYGPNKFRRQANRGETIVLFGEGEERRDHVDVDDIATLVRLVLDHRSSGVLNIATGTVSSFRALADKAVALSPHKVDVKSSPRTGPMPHNGYRPFDPAATADAFPEFHYTAIDDGLARAQRQEFN
ncbi:MAG TPA: NAD-dependent epimerase/dehydratase family protein [Xanthobacteraceae bacterium]|jgi:nucleoside-diphosphate-sugar epimerase|nr:NAD-dependent epimerase/dehydratase family protein [Xanthobacteraceae bacterium]